MLGRLHDPSPDVWTECLFVDPVADIAVLGMPDNQALFNEAEAYSALTDNLPALVIAEADENVPGRLLSLDGNWTRCDVRGVASHRSLWIENAKDGIHGGMSGSPILNVDGLAIGVICVSDGGTGIHTEGRPNPRLTHNLPGWVLRDLK